jgi:hypothetical protein
MPPSKKSKPKARTRKTIKFSELKRLSFCNSKKLPQVVNIEGHRMRWVGIGWVDEGELEGDEVEVVDDQPKADKRARRKR